MLASATVVAALVLLATAHPIAHRDTPTPINSDQPNNSAHAPHHPPSPLSFPSANFSSLFPFSRKRGVGLAERKLR